MHLHLSTVEIILLKAVNEKTAAYRLYTTKDGGTSWQYDSEIPCDAVRSFCLSDDHKVYVVDSEGNVYRPGTRQR